MTSELTSGSKLKIFSLYVLMIGLAFLIFHWIQKMGEPLVPSVPALSTAEAAHDQINALLHVLLALAVVIVTARVIGAIFKYLHQPPVIGEVIGGILLGPSLLGRLAPHAAAFILPQAAAPFLGIISQLGVIFYMFLVGLELDLSIIKRSGHATLAISHASIIFPFILGTFLALKLYPEVGTGGVHFTAFALFLGVSMSITAFPVLARILTDRKISKTRMGMVALTCAAVDDATAWCLLAFVVSIVQAKVGSAFVTLLLTLGFIVFMFVAVRPVIARLVPIVETFDRITEGGMAIIFVAILLSSLATEVIGIHAIFGAFLLGAVTPPNSRVARETTERLEDLIRVVFLPAFFAFTGLRTQFGLLNTAEDWKLCGLIILVATVGKFGGSFVAARLTGLNNRDAAGLGILMNTRGLVELIVLNIGLDLKVISPTLFTMLVIMALVTTFMTTPIFHLVTRKNPWTGQAAGPGKAPEPSFPL